MKPLAIIAAVLIAGCITDGADKKLSRIERRQEAEQIARDVFTGEGEQLVLDAAVRKIPHAGVVILSAILAKMGMDRKRKDTNGKPEGAV